MSSREARDNFADLLGAVYFGKQTVKITKKNKVMAVAVNPEIFAAMAEAAKDRINIILSQSELESKTPENIVVRDAIKAVDEVRAEIYDKSQHGKKP